MDTACNVRSCLACCFAMPGSRPDISKYHPHALAQSHHHGPFLTVNLSACFTVCCHSGRAVRLPNQAAIARAELEAQEAAQSPSRRLGAQVRSALRAKSGQLKSAMRASAQDLGRALNSSMHRWRLSPSSHACLLTSQIRMGPSFQWWPCVRQCHIN